MSCVTETEIGQMVCPSVMTSGTQDEIIPLAVFFLLKICLIDSFGVHYLVRAVLVAVFDSFASFGAGPSFARTCETIGHG
jgi:hypothetical protein